MPHKSISCDAKARICETQVQTLKSLSPKKKQQTENKNSICCLFLCRELSFRGNSSRLFVSPIQQSAAEAVTVTGGFESGDTTDDPAAVS